LADLLFVVTDFFSVVAKLGEVMTYLRPLRVGALSPMLFSEIVP
jgi:hypothetical protein